MPTNGISTSDILIGYPMEGVMDIITADNVAVPIESTDEVKALKAMVKRLSGDTKQTIEEIDLMVKTGLITEDTAITMKAEA